MLILAMTAAFATSGPPELKVEPETDISQSLTPVVLTAAASYLQASGTAARPTLSQDSVSPDEVIQAAAAKWTVPAVTEIIGNSITISKGDLGASASSPSNDYFTLVSDFIKSGNDSAVVERLQGNAWETRTTSSRRQRWWEENKSEINRRADLVIIQLADNVTTSQAKKSFEGDGVKLVENIKKWCPNAKIVWVASWYPSKDNINKVENICERTGITFVDISDLYADKNNRSRIGALRKGEDGDSWLVEKVGEATHPGDLGMEKIAERIIEAIQKISFE